MLALFLSVNQLIQSFSISERSLISSETLIIASKIAITCVCLLIVAIPEGMPLAVSIAMALSVTRLKNDNILIKNLEAIQKCAVLDELCISKTGTLTNGVLQVKSINHTYKDVS